MRKRNFIGRLTTAVATIAAVTVAFTGTASAGPLIVDERGSAFDPTVFDVGAVTVRVMCTYIPGGQPTVEILATPKKTVNMTLVVLYPVNGETHWRALDNLGNRQYAADTHIMRMSAPDVYDMQTGTRIQGVGFLDTATGAVYYQDGTALTAANCGGIGAPPSS